MTSTRIHSRKRTTSSMNDFRMTIGGQPVAALRTEPVINPANATAFAEAPYCDEAQLDEAVRTAHAAYASWRARPWTVRRDLVLRMLDAVRRDSESLAELLTREQGKPLDKARGEVNSAIMFAQGYSDMAPRVERLRDTPTQRVEVHRRPLGVVAAITAWNYPLLLALWKIAPALLCGNTVVLKPSPQTPLTALRLGELSRGLLPDGVLNVVSGGDELGESLVRHRVVRKIAFTGSTEAGRQIMSAAGGDLKRLTLELGGNDAGIVLADVDPAAIAPDLFWAKFSNCGQVCAGLKRLFVHETVYEAVCAALVDVATGVKVGDGFAPGTQIGPIQNRAQFERMHALVAEARAAGARTLFEGSIPGGPGYFFPVTILDQVSPAMRVVREEAFGPVLTIQPFHDVEDALRRANDSCYGLGGSVWSGDLAAAEALAQRLESGSAWVNQHPSMGPDIPFAGVKQSGFGVEFSRAGLDQYTDLQVVNLKLA